MARQTGLLCSLLISLLVLLIYAWGFGLTFIKCMMDNSQSEGLYFRINPQQARQFIDHLNKQMSIARKCRPKQN